MVRLTLLDRENAMTEQRIVSFLPSATEMVCALGLTDQLVGITHECDYPPIIKTKPIVVRSAVDVERMTSAEIDKAISERVQRGLSVYAVDEELLQKLAPDLILTQDLCQVCAPSGNEVTRALNLLPKKPQIVWLTPKSLAQINDNLQEIGEFTGHTKEAAELIAAGRSRLERLVTATAEISSRPRVFCMEWVDPIYCSGHWVPEMVRIAGGIDKLAHEGTDSVRISWEEIREFDPEVLIVMPCGCDLNKVLDLVPKLFSLPGWKELTAVRLGRVYAVNANSYFARPGPRVIDGTELLAHLIHPRLFDWNGPDGAYQQLNS